MPRSSSDEDTQSIASWTATAAPSAASNTAPQVALENWCQVPFDLGATVIAMAWNPNLPHRHLFDYYMQKVIHPACNLLLRNKYLQKLFRVKVCHQAVQ